MADGPNIMVWSGQPFQDKDLDLNLYITAIISVKVLAVGLFLSFYLPEKFYLLCKTAIHFE